MHGVRTSRLRLSRGVGLLVLLSTAACSTGWYMYRPEENATATVSGRPAAYYQVPAESPHGNVRVATLGIVALEPAGNGRRVHSMHVRMVVDNVDDNAAWQVDTREQIGTLDGYGRSRPAFAWASSGRPPIVPVGIATSTTIDLYYPLPAPLQSAARIPHFDLQWVVQTPEGPSPQRTSFERLRIEPAPSPTVYAYAGWEWGPGWNGWYDPYWPGYATWQPSPIVVQPPVIVSPPRPNVAPPPVNVAPPARRIR